MRSQARRKDIITKSRHSQMAAKLLQDKIGPVDSIGACRETEDGWLVEAVVKGVQRVYRVKPIIKTSVKQIRPSIWHTLLGIVKRGN